MPAVSTFVEGKCTVADGGFRGLPAGVNGRSRARLRRWQSEAERRWQECGGPQDFLAEATPGAGKTTFALHLVTSSALQAGGCPGPIAVVCPTAHLRKQWQAAAHRFGVNLCTEVSGQGLDQSYHGAALTYQQVLADPDRYRSTLGSGWVVLDECHHAGEGKSWAEAIVHAFDDARHRLSLSGTAFRSDACRIPFIRYGDDGVSLADYRYAYGDALQDGVVRPVFFVTFGGEATWYKGGVQRFARFGEVVSREDAAARLRTALDPAGGWMRNALQRAHERLVNLRRSGHRDAGGLVVCMDQAHARRVAECMRAVTGRAPAVALSDDPDASSVIATFAASTEPWIVAVRQVSEGTDVPRLRVGVWATNAGTELFFRQVVGRFVRMVPALRDQDAYLYLPADAGLLKHARALAEERAHHLPEPGRDEGELRREQPSSAAESDYQALGSTAAASDVVFGSGFLAPEELERAREVARGCGLELDDPLAFAVALRTAAGPGTDSEVPLELKRRALRTVLSRRVRDYCARTGSGHRDAYARLKGRTGKPVSKLNEHQLSRHIRTVEGWLRAEDTRAGVDRVVRP